MKPCLLILLVVIPLSSLNARWGWGAHRFINDKAVDHLPEVMDFFQTHRDYLAEHSVDPDTDGDPGYYHYIDIDYYPEFFSGTLPHEWEAMIDLYGQSIMEDNGLIPWVIEWWMEALTTQLESENWNAVWQTAAELGHYVADSHQPLHLTLNYNGQLTGNYGIHSRYETHMINPHLDDISFEDSTASYWETPLDSTFGYIEDLLPISDLVMDADDRANAADPGMNATYYDLMWEDLGDTTIWTLQRSAIDLASIWYTAWVNAGSPYPGGLDVSDSQVSIVTELQTFPNPFNGTITLNFFLPQDEYSNVRVYDLRGGQVLSLASEDLSKGEHAFHWDGTDQNGHEVNSGLYLVVLQTPGFRSINKITLLR